MEITGIRIEPTMFNTQVVVTYEDDTSMQLNAYGPDRVEFSTDGHIDVDKFTRFMMFMHIMGNSTESTVNAIDAAKEMFEFADCGYHMSEILNGEIEIE